MILVLSPDTVANRSALTLRKVAERRLTRGFRVVPRGGLSSPIFWRILLDQSAPRYMLAVAPFPLAMAIRPDLALAISQAPLLMFAVIYYVESQVLSVPSPAKRRALLPEEEVERRLDIFRQRAVAGLSDLAARRQIGAGRLHLVVEQSALRRVPILTFVSVQTEPEAGAPPQMLALDAEERAALAQRLFAEGLSEADLHLANLVTKTFLRDVPFDAQGVSAHARLMALAQKG